MASKLTHLDKDNLISALRADVHNRDRKISELEGLNTLLNHKLFTAHSHRAKAQKQAPTAPLTLEERRTVMAHARELAMSTGVCTKAF